MHHPRLMFWLTGLAVVVLVLAGCAPRASSGQVASRATTPDLVVDLPALVVDFDAQGQPSVGNVPLSQLSSLVPGGMLSSLVLQPEQIAFFTDSKIQHIQIDNSPNGLVLLVNGLPIPSIRWDGEVLADTAQLVTQLGAGVPVIEKLLPLLTNLGMGVIVRFPLAEGAEPIPTYAVDEAAMAETKAAQQEFLASVGDTPPTIKLPVFYDEGGGWRIGDLTDAEWTSVTGVPFQGLRMNPNTLQTLANMGINEIALSTDPAGIHLSVNGRQLPFIGWDQGEVQNVLALADQMGLWQMLADTGTDTAAVMSVVDTMLPIVQSTNTAINVYFPSGVASTQ